MYLYPSIITSVSRTPELKVADVLYLSGGCRSNLSLVYLLLADIQRTSQMNNNNLFARGEEEGSEVWVS